MAALLRIMTILIIQITAKLLQITTKNYYKLRQFLFLKIQNYYKLRQVLLHITTVFSVITNYGIFYYKLRQLLQITTFVQITSQQVSGTAFYGLLF